MDGLNSSFFTGFVSSSDAGTYVVNIDPVGTNKTGIVQGIPLSSIFASTLGFRECAPYPAGASVLCYHITAERCIVLGIIPEADGANMKFFSRSALKTADGNFDSQNTQGYASEGVKLITHNQNRPTDIVEGEYALANDFGVLLGLFQQLAMLKGSELAQIQCYAIDDLVRLVSHNFQHWTALGEFNIWHDGKAIISEFGATHLSAESNGSPAVTSDGSPVFSNEGGVPLPDDSKDYYKIDEDERIKAIERMKIFMGRLGDFLHLFLVRPDEDAIRALSGELGGKHDRGLADVHFSTDGRISIRSVSSIVLEKTNWIMVPHRVRSPEDPMGDEDIDYETKDPFEFDNKYKYQENPQAYFLQMRDCVAYLQDLYNYKNFFKHEKDFKCSKGPENEETDLQQINQVDSKTQVKFSDYTMRKSGVYLMDNGGVMISDAWGSALIMEGGNIYLQPAKDLIEQPLRNHVVKAGQFASICAKKDIDISSTEEGFRLKTQKVQHFYSDEQGIVFQSNASTQAEPTPNDEAYKEFGGILFKAKDSGVYTYAKQIFDRSTEKALYKSEKLTLESVQDAYMLAEKSIYFLATEDIHGEGARGLRMVSKGTAMLGGTSNTLLGQKGKILGMVPHPNSLPAVLDGVLDCDSLAKIKDNVGDSLGQNLMFPFNEDAKFDNIKFHFLKSADYQLQENEDFIPMTIAQQNDEAFGFLSLKTWTEKEVEGTLPYPGKEKFESFYIKSKLKNLKDSGKDVYSKDSDSLDKQAETIESASLNTYKVLEK